ncbi:tRNA-uridine aminocarboxypropyltransferase A [Magnolia sinica]|uniref:tRNA-uridine aminocarboxypropyltransferase A n=1 Tax=Magnolia sinica TaxID=86752 RepID=UPI00265949EC|nr:tRNA-uridine aminocarboxypropyltransferase A [Magnolia sinica]
MEEKEEEETTVAFNFEYSNEDDNNNIATGTREICLSGCGRPSSVCICAHLPPTPLLTYSRILILHHPHELRHKLSTVPLLSKCLLNFQTLIGRRLRLGLSPLLDSLYHAAASSHRPHALFLFPGTDSSPSVDLHDWAAAHPVERTHDLVLIVFDGTWKHAKEMVSASLPFLSKFSIQVSLKYDVGFDGESAFDSDLVLRKEPFLGCVSTIEAVARALRILEVDGVEIEEWLLSVLRAVAQFQACHFKPVKPRSKLLKKGKQNKKKDSELE